jgi:hypothetical protein
VEVPADGEEYAHRELRDRAKGYPIDRQRLREAARDAAEGDVHERLVLASGPPAGKLGGRLVPGGVVDAMGVRLLALVERAREGAEVRRAAQQVSIRVRRQALRSPDRVHRARGDADRELLARHEPDRDARVRDAVELCRERGAVLARVASC